MRRLNAKQLEKLRAREHARLEKFRDDKGIVTFEFQGPADINGKFPFLMYWWFEGYHLGSRWYGQEYRTAEVEDHRRRWEEKGKVVRQVRTIEASEVQLGDRIFDGQWSPVTKIEASESGAYILVTTANSSNIRQRRETIQIWRDTPSAEREEDDPAA